MMIIIAVMLEETSSLLSMLEKETLVYPKKDIECYIGDGDYSTQSFLNDESCFRRKI